MSTAHGHQNGTVPSIESLQADIVTLKADLAKALGKLKSDVTGQSRDARATITDFASDVADEFTARARSAGKSLTGQIEEQPLASLLVAFGIGFVASRLLAR